MNNQQTDTYKNHKLVRKGKRWFILCIKTKRLIDRVADPAAFEKTVDRILAQSQELTS